MTTSVITPPHTYAEWIAVLDMLKLRTNDEDILQAMRTGTIEWQSGVAERFSRKLVDAVNCRMNGATDRFQKEMSRSQGQERIIVQALLALRKEMSFLSKVMDLPVLPDKDRQRYVQLVTDQAANVQKSLEDSAKKDRSGKLASVVRNHRVDSF